jgi:hypothetical protein
LPEGHPPFYNNKDPTNLGPIKQQRDTSMIATGHGVKWLTVLRWSFTLRGKSKEEESINEGNYVHSSRGEKLY